MMKWVGINMDKQNKRGGMYWKNDKPYLSVTTILSVIDKPALRYWFGKQVYLAMVQNPSLQEKEALSAPYKTTDKAKERGTTVHSIVEAYKLGNEPDLKNVPEQFHGYVSAFYRFAKELNIIVKDQEKLVISEVNHYAGTLDLFVSIDNKNYVLDVKTGKDIYPEAFLQTSAYAEALRDQGIQVDGIGVILLQENGSYKFETSTDTTIKFKGFLACKQLYEALNEEDLKKIGYEI